METKKLRVLKKEELRKVSGGVAPGPNGETCTDHGLPDFLKGDPILDKLSLKLDVNAI